MWRTRVGYAGGRASDPTYRRIGDHTECIQIDFDPARISFGELLDAFFQMHNPSRPAYSTQYASLVLAHDDMQADLARDACKRWGVLLGQSVETAVHALDRFYVAEDYHQKYGLRSDTFFMSEFNATHPDPADFRESTAAARVNGYLYSGGSIARLDAELDDYGLSNEATERLRRHVQRAG